MACLRDHDLAFEFAFAPPEFVHWISYHIRFLWRGQPLINDALLKRSTSYWAGRPTGTFLANEDEEDSFVPFLREVLTSNKPKGWRPLEWDLEVAIYPEEYFPFVHEPVEIIRESAEFKAKRVRPARQPHPTTACQMIILPCWCKWMPTTWTAPA